MKLMEKPEGFTKENSQICKGVAVIWLLIYHLFGDETIIQEMGVRYAPLPFNSFLRFALFGKISVSIFVILTAYGISYKIFSIDDKIFDSYKQAFKRFFKLLGNFFIMYVSVLIVFGSKLGIKGLEEIYGPFFLGFINMFTDSVGLAETFGTGTLNQTWWYMDLIYMLIFLVPLLAWASKKIGYAIIPLVLFLPFIFTMSYTSSYYFFSMAIGVSAAYGDWVNKIIGLNIPKVVKWIVGLVGIVLLPIFRHAIPSNYDSQTDALVGFFFILTTAVLFATVPVLRDMLHFIGKHSLNIFLVHSFFFRMFYKEEIYRFKNPFVIFLILLLVSLFYSIVLEAVKKLFALALNKVKQGENIA